MTRDPDGWSARSYLFVPATRLDRIPKAVATGCDIVIVDLEDSVAEQDKVRVRGELEALSPSPSVWVRVNAVHTPYWEADIAMVSRVRWAAGVVLPMVRSADDVARTRERLLPDLPVLALVETAEGIVAADDIATSGASRLALGSADFSADLAAPPSDALLAYPRARLAVASAAAGLPGPVDGPTLSIGDVDQLARDASTAKAMGMGGKLCVHPSQVGMVHEVFGYSEDEKAWAQEILDGAQEHGGGVFVIRGEMVDAPVLARAVRVLRR